MVFDANHHPVSVQPFATDVQSPVNITLGPDGMLYYLSFTTGEVRRIRFNGPVAAASATTPTNGYSPLTVSFSSAGSSNPGGGQLSYLWDFGDGTTSTAANPSHTYTSSTVRTFTARLTVTSQGQSSTDTVSVTVGSTPPTPSITAPVNGTTVFPGQTITYRGSATDPDEGTLGPSALSWTVLLHHNTHVHTFVGGTGAQGSFLAEDHGDIGTFSYEVILTATDSSGLKTSTSVNLPVAADTSPPTDPTGLTATAAGSSQVNLGWAASTDNAGVAGYRVERCQGTGCTSFAQVGTPTATSFTDTGLAPSSTYRYRVRAVDASGNFSGYSAVAEATTGAAPATPPGLVGAWAFAEGNGTTTADSSGNGNAGTITGASWTTQGRFGNALSFNGTSSHGPGGGFGFARPDHGDDPLGLDPADGQPERLADHPAARDRRLLPQCQQQRRAAAPVGWRDSRRKHPVSERPDRQSGQHLDLRGVHLRRRHRAALHQRHPGRQPRRDRRHPDHQQPALDRRQQPLRRVLPGPDRRGPGLQPGAHPGRGPERHEHLHRAHRSRHLAANSSGGLDCNRVRLQPGESELVGLDRQRRRRRLPGRALPGHRHNFALGAHRATANRSAPGEPPGRPRPTTSASPATGSSAARARAAPTSPRWARPPPPAFSDTGLAPSTTYRYQVRAVDASGNFSGYSAVASASTPAQSDTTPPSAPTGLSATAISSSRIDLGWTASTDNVGVAGYRVERCQGAGCTNFAQVAPPTGTTYSDTGLSPSTTYRYQVRAVDAAGNLSPYSVIATATTPAATDTTPPSAPTGLAATAVSASRIDLNWTAATDNVGVAGYQVERCQGTNCTNFAQVGTPTATTYSSTGLQANTSYRFRVRAVDAAGNLSPYSAIVTGRTLANDTTRPTAPTGLTATAVGPTGINVGWTASTDNVGVTGYRVERCQGGGCTNFAQIATPTATTYGDTGLAPSTTYRYRVRAVDAAGNLSTYSTAATTTTPAVLDTTPPTDPTGLTATAAGSSQVGLSWTASSDNVGVAGYRVERCPGAGCTNFAQIATPTATTYGDTGLAPSTTYRYRVRAVDAVRQPERLLRRRPGHHRRRSGHAPGPGRGLGVRRGEPAPPPPIPPATGTPGP